MVFLEEKFSRFFLLDITRCVFRGQLICIGAKAVFSIFMNNHSWGHQVFFPRGINASNLVLQNGHVTWFPLWVNSHTFLFNWNIAAFICFIMPIHPFLFCQRFVQYNIGSLDGLVFIKTLEHILCVLSVRKLTSGYKLCLGCLGILAT